METMAEVEQRRDDDERSATSEVEVKTVVDTGMGSTEDRESSKGDGKKNLVAGVLTPEEPSKVASSGVDTASEQAESPDSTNNDTVEISEGEPTNATKPSAIDTKGKDLGDKKPTENENDTVSLRREEKIIGDETEDLAHEPELENTASEMKDEPTASEVKDEPEETLDADDHKHEVQNNDVENKTRSEEAASETYQNPLDILKLPGTDADKFKRLSELLSAGEMSSKDFVSNVLGVVGSMLQCCCIKFLWLICDTLYICMQFAILNF